METRQLEELLLPLLARRDALEEGSPEYKAVLDEIGKALERYGEPAYAICEEYNTQPSE